MSKAGHVFLPPCLPNMGRNLHQIHLLVLSQSLRGLARFQSLCCQVVRGERSCWVPRRQPSGRQKPHSHGHRLVLTYPNTLVTVYPQYAYIELAEKGSILCNLYLPVPWSVVFRCSKFIHGVTKTAGVRPVVSPCPTSSTSAFHRARRLLARRARPKLGICDTLNRPRGRQHRQGHLLAVDRCAESTHRCGRSGGDAIGLL